VKISIIIPAFNEEKLLPATLAAVQESMKSFQLRKWPCEIIVCDNNSTDQTAVIATTTGTRVVFEPVNQIGRARNCGAASATGEWLMFVDADSRPTPELFARTGEVIEADTHLAGGCLLTLDQQSAWAKPFEWLWGLASRLNHWAAGSFIFVRREAFEAIGGFDVSLFASEEIDLSIRLNRLARKQGRPKMHIIKTPRMITSGRKLNLYSKGEHLAFILRAALTGGRSLRKLDQCAIWYDGRR